MERKFFIKNEGLQKLVKKHLPNFDFSRPLTYWERHDVVKIATKKQEEEYAEERLAEISRMGIEPGCKVRSEGEVRTVKKVSVAGFLILKGLKGAFSHRYWEKV